MNSTPRARSWLVIPAIALVALLSLGANPLSAQTAEGTVITNTATATYTDANGNTYTAASGSVSVTVGFQGSLAVTSPAGASPSSPSTDNTVTWTITNNGNGPDQVVMGASSTDTDVAGNLRYVYNAVTYTSLSALNTALAAPGDSIPAGASITIGVLYDVQAGEGGNASSVQLTATSTRTGGDSNNSTTLVTAVLAGTVSVASDNPTIDRLPSNGTVLYVETFQVGSGLTGTADINLTASIAAPNAATVVLIGIREQGAASWEVPPSTTISFSSGETRTIEVQYRVDGGVGDAGSSSTVTLTATGPAAAGSPTAADDHVVTIVGPSLTVTKTAHASEADALAGAPTLSVDPQPGQTIWYRVEVTNSGTASAVMTGGSNGISDDFSSLPVTYVASSLNQTGSPITWTTLAESGAVITGTIAAGIPGGGGTAWFVFAVVID
ncbi:MAG: hypothetical protein OEN56_07990 [Gemmatimonadota bacterium]|nr:hypothetical protein [Gemmatimonadota bacterium]